jgi:hypothetical protein
MKKGPVKANMTHKKIKIFLRAPNLSKRYPYNGCRHIVKIELTLNKKTDTSTTQMDYLTKPNSDQRITDCPTQKETEKNSTEPNVDTLTHQQFPPICVIYIDLMKPVIPFSLLQSMNVVLKL